jgi:DNA-binding HxlR family transcriptional regulator
VEVVGEKWTLLTLREVFLGVHRFDQIATNTGVSRDLLAARLRKLVDEGVLERRQYSARPARHEYHLTQAGLALQDVLLTLMAWGDRYITDGPAPTVWTHSCGRPFAPRLTCAGCEQPATPESLELRYDSPSVVAVAQTG